MFSSQTQNVREPAVAGQFYPADASELLHMVQNFMQQAKAGSTQHVKALIAPHAGLIYSGPIAASAYHCIKAQAEQISRVVLLGPSHRVGFNGIATCSARSYHMPFGDIPLDLMAIEQIKALPQVVELDQAHEFEHSLEVQLPFLQNLIRQFTLVPLVVGDCAPGQVAEVLEMLWGGDETLIVVSSDLSHYNSYEVAQQQDRTTSQAIVENKPEKIGYEDACGRNPVNGLLLAAQQHQLTTEMVDLRNSGDTAGSLDRVVGYGAYVFTD